MSDRAPTAGGRWTDEQLDAALEALAPVQAISDGDLEELRRRVLTPRGVTLGKQTGTAVAAFGVLSRRHKRVLAAGIAGACLLAGGVTAAATGLLDLQARRAFATGSTYPFNIDASTATMRISTSTPDGGSAQLWTANGRDECVAVLADDPGVQPEGKSYRPTAACGSARDDPTEGVGGRWQSAKTGQYYQLWAGHTDASAVAVTFTDITGISVTTPAKHGYYIAYLPLTTPQSEYTGLAYSDQSGRRTDLITAHAPDPG